MFCSVDEAVEEIKNGKIVDDFRIRKVLPTIKFLKSRKAKVIIISHIGRDSKDTLRPVAKYLNKLIKVKFFSETIGGATEKFVANMKSGDVVILENLRKNTGEKRNSKKFAGALAKLGDMLTMLFLFLIELMRQSYYCRRFSRVMLGF